MAKGFGDEDDVQEQISEFQERRDHYMHARQMGNATEENLRKVQEAQEELHEIPTMSEYLEVQNELELRLQEINEIVSDELAVDFGQKAGGCCED